MYLQTKLEEPIYLFVAIAATTNVLLARLLDILPNIKKELLITIVLVKTFFCLDEGRRFAVSGPEWITYVLKVLTFDDVITRIVIFAIVCDRVSSERTRNYRFARLSLFDSLGKVLGNALHYILWFHTAISFDLIVAGLLTSYAVCMTFVAFFVLLSFTLRRNRSRNRQITIVSGKRDSRRVSFKEPFEATTVDSTTTDYPHSTITVHFSSNAHLASRPSYTGTVTNVSTYRQDKNKKIRIEKNTKRTTPWNDTNDGEYFSRASDDNIQIAQEIPLTRMTNDTKRRRIVPILKRLNVCLILLLFVLYSCSNFSLGDSFYMRSFITITFRVSEAETRLWTILHTATGTMGLFGLTIWYHLSRQAFPGNILMFVLGPTAKVAEHLMYMYGKYHWLGLVGVSFAIISQWHVTTLLVTLTKELPGRYTSSVLAVALNAQLVFNFVMDTISRNLHETFVNTGDVSSLFAATVIVNSAMLPITFMLICVFYKRWILNDKLECMTNEEETVNELQSFDDANNSQKTGTRRYSFIEYFLPRNNY